MLGKEKCKILKEIRQRIADENDIPYITRECTFHGDCSGTCPRCESELRYLERQLALRTSMKKRVTIAALCAGMALATAGCSSKASSSNGTGDSSDGSVCTTQEGCEQTTDQKDKKDPNSEKGVKPVEISTEELMGEVPYIEEPEEQ